MGVKGLNKKLSMQMYQGMKFKFFCANCQDETKFHRKWHNVNQQVFVILIFEDRSNSGAFHILLNSSQANP